MKHDQIADYLNQTITNALEGQNIRFREYWEPRAVAALVPLSGECLGKIKQALARQRLEDTIERLAGVWQSRLVTIARTLAHAWATRLRLAQA